MSNTNHETEGEESPSRAVRHSFRKGSMLQSLDMPKNKFGQVVLESDGPKKAAEQKMREQAAEMGVSFEDALLNSTAIWDVVKKSVAENPGAGDDDVEGSNEYAEYKLGQSRGLDDLAAQLLEAEEREYKPMLDTRQVVAQAQPVQEPRYATHVPPSNRDAGNAILANYCPNCGTKFIAGKFCSECGMKRILICPSE